MTPSNELERLPGRRFNHLGNGTLEEDIMLDGLWIWVWILCAPAVALALFGR